MTRWKQWWRRGKRGSIWRRGKSQSWAPWQHAEWEREWVLCEWHSLSYPPSGEITPLIQHVLSDRQDHPSFPSKDMKRSPLWFKYQWRGLENVMWRCWRETSMFWFPPLWQLTRGDSKSLVNTEGSYLPLAPLLGGGIIPVKRITVFNNGNCFYSRKYFNFYYFM